MDKKTCKKCNIEKDISLFYNNNTYKDWRSNSCKKCDLIYTSDKKKTIEWLVGTIYYHQRASCRNKKRELPNYSKKELITWFKKQKNYIILYNNWIISWYDKQKIPSVDRIDDSKTYIIDNIQLMSWEDNCKKARDSQRLWIINSWNKIKKVKKIDIYSFKIIKEYFSMSEASRDNSINVWNISNCCKWKQRTAGGFIWKYA